MNVLGCLLPVVVHAANIHDTKGGISTAKRAYERFPSIQKFCADAGYRGTFVSDLKEQLDLDVDISEKIKPHQWEKISWRWVIERTLSWLNHSRHLSKDYEISVSAAETMVKIAHSHTLGPVFTTDERRLGGLFPAILRRFPLQSVRIAAMGPPAAGLSRQAAIGGPSAKRIASRFFTAKSAALRRFMGKSPCLTRKILVHPASPVMNTGFYSNAYEYSF